MFMWPFFNPTHGEMEKDGEIGKKEGELGGGPLMFLLLRALIPSVGPHPHDLI